MSNTEGAVQVLSNWLKKKGGSNIHVEWAQEYPTEVRVSCTHTMQRGGWTQIIDAVYTIEKPIRKNTVVKHQYSTRFCETNGKQTVNWI